MENYWVLGTGLGPILCSVYILRKSKLSKIILKKCFDYTLMSINFWQIAATMLNRAITRSFQQTRVTKIILDKKYDPIK